MLISAEFMFSLVPLQYFTSFCFQKGVFSLIRGKIASKDQAKHKIFCMLEYGQLVIGTVGSWWCRNVQQVKITLNFNFRPTFVSISKRNPWMWTTQLFQNGFTIESFFCITFFFTFFTLSSLKVNDTNEL